MRKSSDAHAIDGSAGTVLAASVARKRVDDTERPLIGESIAFKDVVQRINRIARVSAPVLIEGETGTGKELVARSLHEQSARRHKPFLPVNCGALPDSLIENELFGHEDGAYTGARTAHHGLVAQAEGGTLFLDEVEALSARGQAALLRLLDSEEYRPLGGKQMLRADVRVIAASNANLSRMLASREFRTDLFFRLDVMRIDLPPLRERDGDVVLLAEHFMDQCCKRYGRRRVLDRESIQRIATHHWPGNVRELENTIHRAFLLADGDVAVLPPLMEACVRPPSNRYVLRDTQFQGTFAEAKATLIRDFEREYLRRLIDTACGNVTLAARLAGVERRWLGKRLRYHGFDRAGYYSPAVKGGSGAGFGRPRGWVRIPVDAGHHSGPCRATIPVHAGMGCDAGLNHG